MDSNGAILIIISEYNSGRAEGNKKINNTVVNWTYLKPHSWVKYKLITYILKTIESYTE